MPHFYRYRVEDEPQPVRRPAVQPVTVPAAPALVSLLGQEAELLVPGETGQNRLIELFTTLETAVQQLRQENRQLRGEMERLQGEAGGANQMSALAREVEAVRVGQQQSRTDWEGRLAGLTGRMDSLMAAPSQSPRYEGSGEEVDQLKKVLAGMEVRLEAIEQRPHPLQTQRTEVENKQKIEENSG